MGDVAAIRLVFLLQPLVVGSWFTRIPQVQAGIGLSEGELAFALIGMPVGLLVTLAFGGRVAEAMGTRRLLTLGLASYLLAMPMPAFAASWMMLFSLLVLAGSSMAIAQLSLNVTAAEVEARSDRLIMNGCHGFWSLGVLLGSAIGAAMAELRIAPGPALLIVAVASFLPLLIAARSITDFALPSQTGQDTARILPSKPLLAIALFGFGVATTEGAMADWLAVFMTNIHGASPGIAGASYTIFALSVAIGRFQGDALKARVEVGLLAQCLVGLAVIGLSVALVSPSMWVSFMGVAMIGIGVSIGFPLAVSAASGLAGRSSAANVAMLTQITLSGFLIGPPVIGLIAEQSDMRLGLAGLYPALLLAFVFAKALRPR